MAEPRVSRPFLVIAGLGVVLILGLLGYKLLGSSGGDGTSTATGGSTATTLGPLAGGVSTTTTTAPPPPVTPNQAFDVFTTKNPFQPVVSVDTGTGGSTTPPPTQSTTPPSGGATPPATVPANQAPSAGTAVALLEVFDDNGTITARVQVGSTVYTVTAGTTFATSYKVVSIEGNCAQFQFGDSPFQLCVGEQVLK